MTGPTSLQVLTRRHRTLIRELLHDKRVRMREGAFIIEGAKACRDLIQHSPQAILSLTLSPRYLDTEDTKAHAARAMLNAPQFSCSDALFDRLSDVEAPQGILAIVRQPQWDERSLLEQPRILGLFGDRLRDPANVGTIIRTAAALNLTGLWLTSDSADPFGPKVVRAAAGTLLTLPVFYGAEPRRFIEHGCVIYSALVPQAGTVSLRSIQSIPRRLVMAVGNEGEGLADSIVGLSTVRFAIPLASAVESLNVAATAAIAAFYFTGLPIGS
ncbi:MAG: RNA methyltransferase [Nitrospira sp.]|nr:RNA methyltransferase [Nitrospira sp.]